MYPPGWHDHYELAYVDAGTCAMVCDTTPYALGPHSLCVIPAGCQHYEAPSNPSVGYRLLWVKVRPRMIQCFTTEYSAKTRGLSKDELICVETNAAISMILDSLCLESKEHALNSDVIQRGYLLALVGTIARGVVKGTQERNDSPEFEADPVVGPALAYMRDRYSDPTVRVGDIARHVGLSPGHFSVYFRMRTGISPYQYLLRLRLERAKALLLEARTTIGQVAEQVGFNSQFHFSRAFKKAFAVTPSAFRGQGHVDSVAHP
ncbi:MAG TPA: AraC family transcriptional regulator [Limnochordia bacterium]